MFSYASDVKIIYRDFPVISEDSLGLALAGRCAGEQGLFWLMHDGLFEEQGKITNSKLTDIAGQIGADIDKFNDCLKNKKYLDDIKKDFVLGEKLDVKGLDIVRSSFPPAFREFMTRVLKAILINLKMVTKLLLSHLIRMLKYSPPYSLMIKMIRILSKSIFP